DLVQHIKHPESLVNFIAAYGTHSTITSATTLDGKRAAAAAIVFGGAGAPADRLDFLNATGTWADNSGLHPKDVDGVTTTGIGNIDFWVGGLAEKITPFGGMLGPTFNFVFENQMEKLQDGDRFYYLERTAGMNFNAELENNTFAELVMANTDAVHLNALIFKAPAFTFEVDQTRQFNPDVVLRGRAGRPGRPVRYGGRRLRARSGSGQCRSVREHHSAGHSRQSGDPGAGCQLPQVHRRRPCGARRHCGERHSSLRRWRRHRLRRRGQ